MSKEPTHTSMAALKEKFAAANVGRVVDRAASERRAMRPDDARQLRGKGPSEQLNIRVSPEFKRMLFELCRDIGLTQTEIVMRGVELYAKSMGRPEEK